MTDPISRRRATSARRKRGVKGSALIELSLLAPWILFLFVGIVDLGFYSYALIAVENAARVGAEYTAKSTSTAADQTGACTRIRAELASLPNVASLTSCGAAPLVVTATSVTGVDSHPATSVSITYQGVNLIPIPGLLMSRLNVTRIVQMRVMQ
jgi:Flp pilus assembly protein TadG